MTSLQKCPQKALPEHRHESGGWIEAGENRTFPRKGEEGPAICCLFFFLDLRALSIASCTASSSAASYSGLLERAMPTSCSRRRSFFQAGSLQFINPILNVALPVIKFSSL